MQYQDLRVLATSALLVMLLFQLVFFYNVITLKPLGQAQSQLSHRCPVGKVERHALDAGDIFGRSEE